MELPDLHARSTALQGAQRARWPRPKTTIGLGAPIEVFIYYLGPPVVACHRGPPSTTRARVDRRIEMLTKSLNYCPRQARALS